MIDSNSNELFAFQLDYDGQRKRTKVKSKDLDPTWNEKVNSLSTLGSLNYQIYHGNALMKQGIK